MLEEVGVQQLDVPAGEVADGGEGYEVGGSFLEGPAQQERGRIKLHISRFHIGAETGLESQLIHDLNEEEVLQEPRGEESSGVAATGRLQKVPVRPQEGGEPQSVEES